MTTGTRNRNRSQYRERDSEGRFTERGRESDYDQDYDSDYDYDRGRDDYEAEYEDDYDNDYDRDYSHSGHDGRGWFGNSREHSRAAERGWQNRGGEENYNYERGDRRRGSYSRRGFASMNPEDVRLIAHKGGIAAHESGHAHEWDTEEARRAGHLGGEARWDSSRRGERRSDNYSDGRYERSRGGRGFASMDRNEVRRIAKKGGENSHGGRGRSHSRSYNNY